MSAKTPSWLIEKAIKCKSDMKRDFEQARDRIPDKYLDFLIKFPRKEKLANKEFPIDSHAEELGVYFYEGVVMINLDKPYFTVDGRLQMLVDEHREAEKRYTIHPPQIMQVMNSITLSVTIESELYGSATGTIEIGQNSKGVDRSNPIANAQTSAIGRALGFLGYGLIGTGIGISEFETIINDPVVNPSHQDLQQPPNNLYDVRIQSHPAPLADGSVLIENVSWNKGMNAKLWFPTHMRQYGLSIKPQTVIKVLGFYDENTNCINVTELQSELAKNA